MKKLHKHHSSIYRTQTAFDQLFPQLQRRAIMWEENCRWWYDEEIREIVYNWFMTAALFLCNMRRDSPSRIVSPVSFNSTSYILFYFRLLFLISFMDFFISLFFWWLFFCFQKFFFFCQFNEIYLQSATLRTALINSSPSALSR